MTPQRVLVGYITRAGYVREVAEAIAQRLQAHGYETDVADLELSIRHPRKYEAVVLGCGARFGHHPSAMASFIAQHRARLVQRPTGFFSVERDAAKPDAMTALFERTEWRPVWTLALQGLQGARLRRLRAWLQDRLDKRVSRVAAPTDWARIESFADSVAADLTARASRRPVITTECARRAPVSAPSETAQTVATARGPASPAVRRGPG
jgi:menaquinone-dependent protoporphyrinogen IX oxidase